MPEINLLHSENLAVGEGAGIVSRLVSRLLILLLIMAILVYAGLFGLNWLNNKKLATTQADIQAAQTEALANKDRNELVTRQEQMQQLETLVNSHLYWSYLLPELARVTLKSAKYTEIDAKSDGTLTLAVTLPNYEEVEKFMQIFDLPEYNQQYSNVRIVSIGNVQSEKAIETQVHLELTFNPAYIKGRL